MFPGPALGLTTLSQRLLERGEPAAQLVELSLLAGVLGSQRLVCVLRFLQHLIQPLDRGECDPVHVERVEGLFILSLIHI